MRLRRLSIFQRLLYAITGTSLIVALISGGAHYFYTTSLIESSVRSQMTGVLATAQAFLERTYAVPTRTDLRVMAASPAVHRLLEASGNEIYLDQPAAERLFLSVSRTNLELYSSLLLVDPAGRVRVLVMGRQRLRPELVGMDGESQRLFERLAGAPTGTVLFQGPLQHADGRYSVLAGIALRDPDVSGYGGAIIAQIPLDRFVAYLRDVRVLDHHAAWLVDAAGNEMLRPPAPAPQSATAGDGHTVEREGVVVSSPPLDDGSLVGLFRIAFCLPAKQLAASTADAELIAIAVLTFVVIGSCLLALVLTRQVTGPIRALAGLTEAVGAGDFTQRIRQAWGGDEGRLAQAFNHMLDALNATTVSRAYVNGIVESMGDGVIVVDGDGVIETVNHAAARLFARDEHELVGAPLAPLLPEATVREQFLHALGSREGRANIPLSVTRADGNALSLWLSCSPMHGSDGRVSGAVVVARDVTEQIRAQQELEHAHQALQFHVVNSPLAVVEWDSEFRVQRWSGRAQELFGWRADEVVGKRFDEWAFVVEDDMETVGAALGNLAEGEPRNLCRNRNYRKDGTVVHCEWHNSLMLDENGAPLSVLALAQDITESARLSEELSYQATHDALTGLYNRRAFDDRLEEVITEVRHKDAAHVLCYIDLDQFKVVNDSCGHAAGDELLRQIGRLLSHGVRRNDTVARLGGDEFAVLMEHCEMPAAREVARKLLHGLREYPFVWEGRTFHLSASMGLVSIDGTMPDMAGVMSAADSACIAAKHEGRDRVHVFDDHDDLARRRGEAQWVSRINQALDDDRFFLMAQPIVSVVDEGGAQHFEMLLRMTDEEGREVVPGTFLPAAERYHLMPKLDRWVIRRTVELLASTARGSRIERTCFVNISGQTLADESLRDFVQVQLERTGVAPETLCFEITETAAVADFAQANAFIESVSQLGCRFALDDFGAGVSSFAYLKNLPVQFLKIDGMFVRDIVDDPTSRALVRSINEVGHTMGKRTVAEFVEDARILEELRVLGVDFVQGFHVGRPQPVAAVLGTSHPRPAVAAI